VLHDLWNQLRCIGAGFLGKSNLGWLNFTACVKQSRTAVSIDTIHGGGPMNRESGRSNSQGKALQDVAEVAPQWFIVC
jgi:hypothetical protein